MANFGNGSFDLRTNDAGDLIYDGSASERKMKTERRTSQVDAVTGHVQGKLGHGFVWNVISIMNVCKERNSPSVSTQC
jgi:hypothetical protein